MHTYRGWKSTKLHLSLIAMAVITAAYVYAGAPEHAFDGFTMGVLGAAAIYSSASTAEKFTRPPPPEKP